MTLVTPPSMRYNVVPPGEYARIHRETVEKLEDFWALQASSLVWARLWDRVLEGWGSGASWFKGGLLSPYFNIVGRHASGGLAGKPAVIEESEDGVVSVASYKDLDDLSAIAARGLRDLGVERGDWVVVYAPQSIEATIAILASLRLGAVVETVFTGFGWWELRRRIKRRAPKAVFAFDGFMRRGKRVGLAENLERALENTGLKPEVFVVEKTGGRLREGWRRFDELLDGSPLREAAVVESSHPLVGFHVGYESDFKPLAHGTGGFLTQVVAVTRWLGLRARDTLFCTVSLGWITGVSHCLIGALAVGSTVLFYSGAPDYPSWSRWLELLDYYSVTVMLTTSTALRILAKNVGEGFRDYELDSLKAVITTGEPMEEELWRAVYERLASGSSPLIDSVPGRSGRIPVFNTYIQTELGSIAVGYLPNSAFAPIRPGAAGLPVLGLAVEVVDSWCHPVRESWGRLAVLKPWPATPVEKPAEFEEAWSSGCYDTRDEALATSDGYVYVRGRRDSVLKSSGYRLSPGAIESAVEESGAAVRAVAFSIPDDERFEAIVLAIESGDPAQARRVVRERVGPIAEPSLILSESLEGDKRSLRRALREKLARR